MINVSYFAILGSTISEHRKNKGYTQQQLADRLFEKRATIANWETGRVQIDVRNLFKLCEVLDITPETLSNKANAILWRSDE